MTDASLRALTFARSLAGRRRRRTAGRRCCSAPADRVPAGLLGRYGVTEVYVVEPAALDGYAPQAWARTLEGLLSVTLAGAVVAAGPTAAARCWPISARSPGSRWPRTASQPAARRRRRTARCGVPAALGRAAHRGRRAGGHAGPAHRGHRCRRRRAGRRGTGRPSPPSTSTSPTWPRRTCGSGRPCRPAATAGCRWPPPGWWSAAAAASAAPTASPRWRNWPACSAGWSGCPAWSPARAGGRTPSRSARPAPRSPRSSTWPAGSAGRSSTWRAARSAKHIVVVNTDPSAPILARADYAVIGDLAEVIPALVAALKERA